RKKLLTPAHKYMTDILADRLSLEPTAVEEFILDSSLAPFDNFFAKGGSKTISFVYQESEVPGIGSNPDYVILNILFSMVDARDGLLKGIKDAYSFVLPALESQNWGVLDKSRHGEKYKKNFKYTIKQCLTSLDGKSFSSSNCSVRKSFFCVRFCCLKGITAVFTTFYGRSLLIESEQLRKEVDSAGPLSELEHWKRMSLRFSSIISHIQGPECKAVVMMLQISRSKIMKMWRELDARITDCVNEAKGNVKFLHTLEKVCQPLYNSDPVTIMKSVQNVINAIHMIYSVSPIWYSCRSYITDNGTCLIWDQDSEDIIKKMQNQLRAFMRSCFSNITSSQQALCLIERSV
uniref:Dynein heavy chain tail domain-containing protein n=1 Tax=Mastacembelus armatus TaxID=205130 RepID=A0A7N8X5Q4_9TELE